jgi:hypothetical protein
MVGATLEGSILLKVEKMCTIIQLNDSDDSRRFYIIVRRDD